MSIYMIHLCNLDSPLCEPGNPLSLAFFSSAFSHSPPGHSPSEIPKSIRSKPELYSAPFPPDLRQMRRPRPTIPTP
ncbi:hypothetical protein CFRS1_v007224 [Colletotrichum fructicola]|nr:hypothetical protein CFRS1_v007224 [Colletotrichum fructicola]